MSSVDQAEIDRFSSHAKDWWNPDGALRPLHMLNPVRLEYIRDAVCNQFERTSHSTNSLKGLNILDLGCGGGLLCEPLARLGARVTGLDASKEAIKVASAHAALSDLFIHYVQSDIESFAKSPKHKSSYEVITALEILEHVADIGSFLADAAKLLCPNGLLILSTLNRTVKSYALGIVAAEYILKWVPSGTHDWRKFIRPSELNEHLQKLGLEITDMTGMTFDPFNKRFHLQAGRVDVNYLMTAKRL